MRDIPATESSTLEYKRELPADDRKWLKTVVAFANGKGGRIVFGVDDETHTVIGVPEANISRTIDQLTDVIIHSCTPQIVPDVYVESIGEKYVVVVEITAGQNTPYYLTKKGIEGGTYVRVAASTRLAEPNVRLELILRSRGLTYDQHLAPHAAPATAEEINNLCQTISRYSKREQEITQEHLTSWGLIQPQHDGTLLPSITFCLFARPHAIHFSRIQCAVFLGKDRSHFLDSQELTGPIHEIAEQAVAYVLRNTRTSYRIQGIYREEIPEIPMPALREIVINALLHRNYLSPSFIQISIHPNRIEFFSPGNLYGNMTKERMLKGNSSTLRNPQLADVFHRMQLVERWGSGIGRIFASFKEQGLTAPKYLVDDMGVTVVVKRALHDLDSPQQTPHGNKKETKSGGNKPRSRSSVSDEEVLLYIQQHPHCTYSQMLNNLPISRRTLSYKLNSLAEKGIICRTGATRSASWNII